MCGGGGDKAARRAAEEQRRREQERRSRITTGTQNIDAALAPFNDDFFNQRQQAYVDYASPQLDDQFADAKKELIYALSRGGLLQSSVAADKQRRLDEERARYEQDIMGRAAQFANEGRNNLENTRGNLLSQLTATEDPSAVAASAAREAGLLNAAPQFDPLGAFVFNTAGNLDSSVNRATRGRGLVGGTPASNIKPATGSGSATTTQVR